LGYQSKYAQAEEYQRQALAIRRKVLGENHLDTAWSLDYVAGALYHQGKYADAAKVRLEALAIRRRTPGQDLSIAETLFYLGGDMSRQQKYAEAAEFHRQALEIRRKVLGERHALVAETLGYLGGAMFQQGKYAESAAFHRQAFEIRREVLGEQHPDTAQSLHYVAGNLLLLGRYAEAAELHRQALAIRKQVLGERHPDTLETLNFLARDLAKLGQHAAAEPLYRQYLKLCRQVHGEEHVLTARALNNEAVGLMQLGRFAEAVPLCRQSILIHRNVQGVQHLEVGIALHNLAKNLEFLNQFAEAEALLREALHINRLGRGEDYANILSIRSNLAWNLDAQGKYADAEKLYRQALEGRGKLQGEQHAEYALILNNLAVNLDHQGKHAEAEALHRQALTIHRKVLGNRHPHTAQSLAHLALNLQKQDRYGEAEPLLREAVDIYRASLGEMHPETGDGLNSLAMNLVRQGKDAEAETFYRQAVAGFETTRLRVGTSGLERAPYTARRSPFADLAACLARSGKVEEAFRFAEAGLARGLLDDLSASAPVQAETDEQQRARVRAARLNELDRLILPLLIAHKLTEADKTRLGELTKEREKLQTDLAREVAERSRREVFTLDRIQKQLTADTALVFWIDVEGDHWACVVRHSGRPAWVRLTGSGDKGAWTAGDDLSSRLRDSLASGEADWRPLARRLARQRLEPLQPALAAKDQLPAVHRLIAIPAGRMAGVPLEALTDRYTISYAPSGTLFARLHEQHRSFHQPSLLALGDPAFTAPAHTSPPLPEHGLLLTLVLPDGNAGKAGLRSGDVLLRYGEQKLTKLADFKPAAGGESISVRIWRDGQTLDVQLKPGKLGAALHREPAPQALRQQRDFDTLLASRSRDEAKPLPGSRYEVKALQTLFSSAEVLLGSDASEQRLDELAAAGRLRDFRVLHFATHGQINPTTASRSALLMARDRLPDPVEQGRRGRKVYDGRLTVAAIASGWQLDADLVTLSACETALGPQGGGEGLLGFSQVLLHKGARSLLLSLWKVDDTATALLMSRFYENWLGKREGLKKPLPKAEALREAKAWLRQLPGAERDRLAAKLVKGELRGTEVAARPVLRPKEEAAQTPYSHPRYWAAFILMGDSD